MSQNVFLTGTRNGGDANPLLHAFLRLANITECFLGPCTQEACDQYALHGNINCMLNSEPLQATVLYFTAHTLYFHQDIDQLWLYIRRKLFIVARSCVKGKEGLWCLWKVILEKTPGLQHFWLILQLLSFHDYTGIKIFNKKMFFSLFFHFVNPCDARHLALFSIFSLFWSIILCRNVR